MNHENKNLNHPRVEALIRELSQLMGPDANIGMFSLHGNNQSGSPYAPLTGTSSTHP